LIVTFSHQLDLERGKLLNLLSQDIVVKIWDEREYCTARTKLDKPRITRALSSLSSSGSTIQTFVFLQYPMIHFQVLMKQQL
jgi:hypothetical protein